MPNYRIFLLDDQRVERFRTRAPGAGSAELRQQNYEELGVIEADHPYQAWKRLQNPVAQDIEIPRTLGVGDVLVDDGDGPLLLNYWGFEPARWSELSNQEEQHETAEEAVSSN